MVYIPSWDIHWLCDRIGTGPKARIRTMLRLVHTEGMTHAAAAGELGRSRVAVTAAINRWWRRARLHPWTQRDRERLRLIFAASSEIPPGFWAEEVRALCHLNRGPTRSAPPAPVYDELGRPVVSHSPPVEVDYYGLARALHGE